MAANALAFKPAMLAGAHLDSGLSDDADRVRKRVDQTLDSLFGRHLRQALVELGSAYVEASQDNWDGYGARAAQPASLSQAARFLAALPMTITLPDIGVDPDGEVSFTWQRAPRLVFSVSFRPDGVISYAGLFGRNKAHGSETFIGVVPKAISDNLERLYSAEG